MTSPTPREQLLSLLDYVKEMEKLKKSATFVVPDDLFCQHQESLIGLPGMHYNLVHAGDDVWLRINRLQEIAPPEPDSALKPWVTLPKSPDKSPELRDEIVVGKPPNEQRMKRSDHPGLSKLFEKYVAEKWTPWSTAEKPRRRTIAVYNRLFALQQAMTGDSAEQPVEIVWGMGMAVWKPAAGQTVRHPLLTQACEVALDARTFDLDVRPRDADCVLESDCYAELENAGIGPLQAFFKSHQASAATRPSPFEHDSFEPILKAAVGHLDPAGRYEKAGEAAKVPSPGEQLVITDSWVLYARPRSGHVFLEDVERLKKKLKLEDVVLPPAVEKFVTAGDAIVRPRPVITFRGLSSSNSGEEARELYFPLPFNAEQQAIIEKLESGDGVVVQGAPGTGKSHTIANVICHFLAQGKRVLVTSKGEQALTVIQEKVPIEVRALTVALLSSEKEGMEQFEASIEKIGSEVAKIDPAQNEREIARLEASLHQLHGKVAALDHSIARLADGQLRQVRYADREILPEELARIVIEQAEAHGWLTDLVPATGDLRFTADDIASLRVARRSVGGDLVYLPFSLPAADSLPTDAEVIALHQDLVRARAIDQQVKTGTLISLVDTTAATFEQAQALMRVLGERRAAVAAINAAGQRWSMPLRATFRTSGVSLAPLRSAAASIVAEDASRRKRIAFAVEGPAGMELNDDVGAALERLVAGKAPFAWPMGYKEARALLGAVTVKGLKPESPEDWAVVREEMAHRVRARTQVASWNAIANEAGVDTVDGGVGGFRRAAELARHVLAIEALATRHDAAAEAGIERVFGRAALEGIRRHGEDPDAHLLEALAAHLDKGRLSYAMGRVADIVAKLADTGGPVVEDLRELLNRGLGNAAIDEAVVGERWRTLKGELTRLASLRPALVTVDRVAARIEESGAPEWAKRLRTVPANDTHDPELPATWLEAWRWRAAKTHLDALDGHQVLRGLFEKRKSAESDLARTYRALVAEKTWLGVYNNSPESVRRALAAYLTAMQSIGSGAGVRAIRHRRDARAAMMNAHPAVPCWIMPQWRVSETLPADLGVFDLVIVDEASQADMWMLPALLRGKKMLIVGDHKQVSPSAVGIPERKIVELKERFLDGQPNGALMTPDRSIYDLAKVVFAGNSVMLKEHFRCVPAIIEFSNRFYNHEIKPLRIPKRSERLDPPLVDVFVQGGFRKGDVNDPEARAILAEIQTILTDPACERRTIGVVTLLGQKQAPYIEGLIQKHVGAKQMLERRIRVGNPTVFQGDERDIMLLSMVIEKGDHGVPSRSEFEQRFNVAASRARDRMVLFRSVEESDVTPGGLNHQLIAHFRRPFSHDAQSLEALRQLCESDFEREMFDLLAAKGFRLRPQVAVGGYRIDLVVEGAEDRRLAIECDGDRYHGPDRWSDDMTRQRILERAGWTFWRCFASSFVLHRRQVEADLIATLARMGIDPLGSEVVDPSAWVAHRVADPLGLAADDDDDVPARMLTGAA